jgi:3-isopropylmalate/(R)-2-methylmalate dehydratase small subunit
VQPFTKHSGLVMPMDRVNVDTDQMVPKQFLKALTREGFGRTLFYDWRYKGASVLLARANFGCGSSREHAPWAILDYGFRVLIAPSYADIFYNNCFKNGILPVTLPDDQMDELFRRAEKTEGYKLTADLEAQTVTDDSGLKYSFQLDPFRRECLLNGWDDIGLSLRFEKDIAAFEREHPRRPVMYEPLDVVITKPAG